MTHITIEREKLERVLEALEVLIMKHYELTGEVLHKETYAVLEEALAQPPQRTEPVAWAKFLHYPECWDTAAYPTLHDAIHEALAWAGCSVCTQPAAQRKPLTDVTIKEWAERHDIKGVMTDLRCMAEDAETLYLLAEEKNT